MTGRRRRIVWITVGVLLVIGATSGTIAYRVLTSPERIHRIVQSRLADLLPCPVSIGQTRFSFLDGLELIDLQIGPLGPSADAEGANAKLQCAAMTLQHNPFRLILGRYEVERLTATGAVLTLAGDFATAFRPLTALAKEMRSDTPRGDFRLPGVEVRDGRLRLVSWDAGRTQEELTLTVRGRPRSGPSPVYEFAWQRLDGAGAESEAHSRMARSPATAMSFSNGRESPSNGPGKPGFLSSNEDGTGLAGITEWDLRQARLRSLRGGSPWVSIESGVSAFTPQDGAVQVWRSRLGAAGRVRASEFDLFLRGDDDRHEHVSLDVQGTYLSVPAGEVEFAVRPGERFLQLDSVAAVVNLQTNDAGVEGSGLFHGSPVELSIAVPGGLTAFKQPGFGYRLDVSAKAFQFPEGGVDAPAAHRRFISASDVIKEVYTDFTPSGLFDVALSVAKADGVDKPPTIERVLVTARKATATAKVFPYPVRGITGDVEVGPEGIEIRSMCGRNDDGLVCVNGRIEGKSSCAPAELIITGEDILIDEQLYESLGPSFARIHETLSPQGRLDIRTTSVRPPCDGEKPSNWVTTNVVRPDSVTAVHSELPFPLEDIIGMVEFDERRASVDLRGRAGPSPFTATGVLDFVGGRMSDLSLKISAMQLPIEERLFKALSDDARNYVLALNPAGLLNVEIDLVSNEMQETAIEAAWIELIDVSIRHDEFPIPVSGIAGRLDVFPDRVELAGIAGKYEGARISIKGAIIPSDVEKHGESTFDLDIGAQNLRIDDQFVATVPTFLKGALSEWRVDGPIDAWVELDRRETTPGEAPKLAYQAKVRLAGTSVRHGAFPEPFEDVYGTVHIDEVRIRTEDLRGRYGGAAVSAEMQFYGPGGLKHGDGRVVATGVRIDDKLLSALPPTAARKLLRLRPSGLADIFLSPIRVSRMESDDSLEWWASGTVHLHDVQIPGLEMAGVFGELSLSGVLHHTLDGARLGGDLRLDRAVVLDRELTMIDSPWSFFRSIGGVGEASMDRLSANLYDGQASGRAEVRFDPERAEFNMTTIVQGMQLGGFLNAGRDTALPRLEADGRVVANLFLSGELGEPMSYRGGGRFAIEEGFLYRLPLILAIVNVLELNLRPTDSFEEASAEFYIVGQRVSVNDLVIRGGVLALIGSGTLSLPDFAGDFRLINVPDRWWARLPVLAEVMQGVVRELVQVRVTGPFSQPTVRTEPVPRITEELRSLFERRDGRRAISPGRR